MVKKLKEDGIIDVASMTKAMADKADPKKIRQTYHVILLAKTQAGLKNLYKIVSKSYLDYYYYNARVPKTVLSEYREGIIVGSACEAGELYKAVVENKPESELKRIANAKYDKRIELYDNGIKLWDTNMALTMITRGVK